MVQYANEQGLVIVIMGLMEPVDRYPEAEAASIFTRNLVARLMGNFVIFSPSFDSLYKELGDTVGEMARKSTSIHLITQTYRHQLGYAAKNTTTRINLDFCGLQSGAGWGSNPISPETASKNAVDWTLDLYHRTPCKPRHQPRSPI